MFKWRPEKPSKRRESDQRSVSLPLQKPDRALERAIGAGDIEVRFQPQIDPASGVILGVEALARWPGKAAGEDLFVRAAAAGLAERLSRSVQKQALRMAARWTGGLAGLDLSVNLLPQEIARAGYETWLLKEIRAAGLAPTRLTVEITENALLEDDAAVSQRLDRLRAAGVKVAVDDFGTGYASLAWLTSLPLDQLKIDRGLIADLVRGQRERIVVKALIDLAHQLGLQVVVEGVESTEQLALLAGWNCDLYQGFFGAGALDEVELARFVAASTAEAA